MAEPVGGAQTQKLRLKYKPRPAFLPLHQRTQRFAVVVAHRRAGKTVASVRELEKGALTCALPNPRFAYIAPLYRQAKQVAWDYVKQGHYQLREAGLQSKLNESELKLTYPNNGVLQLFGAENPDSLRGMYFDGVVLDEYASIPPDVLTEIILPALADRKGWLIVIGTPKGRNAFYHLVRAASKDSSWFTTILRASETGIIPPEELSLLKANMNPDAYAREFECDFDVEAFTQFVPYDLIKESFNRRVNYEGVRALGVDPSRFGDDRTGIIFRSGNSIPFFGGFTGLSTFQLAARVVELINRFKPQACFIDEIGIGAGVVDALREMPLDVPCVIHGVNASRPGTDDQRYVNLRAEVWDKMRQWVQRHAALDETKHRELIDDLTSPEYDYDVRGRLKLESKDSMRERNLPSPDLADALALTFAFQLSAVQALQPGWRPQEFTAPPEDPFETLYAEEDAYLDFTRL